MYPAPIWYVAFLVIRERLVAVKWPALALVLVALVYLLCRCGGSVEPIADAGADAPVISPVGFSTTCSGIVCDDPVSWTWTSDAGVVPCSSAACPLGAACTFDGGAGVCQ
jgi:hypothetical protein